MRNHSSVKGFMVIKRSNFALYIHFFAIFLRNLWPWSLKREFAVHTLCFERFIFFFICQKKKSFEISYFLFFILPVWFNEEKINLPAFIHPLFWLFAEMSTSKIELYSSIHEL